MLVVGCGQTTLSSSEPADADVNSDAQRDLGSSAADAFEMDALAMAGDATTDANLEPYDSGPGCPPLVGPFGISAGSIVDPSLALEGFAPHGDSAQLFHLGDFYDCDGSRGINAIEIIETSAWCGACYADATEFNTLLTTTWSGLGVTGLWLLAQDTTSTLATSETALNYRNSLSLNDTYVVADPPWTFDTPGVVISNTLIDPRTMRVIEHGIGYPTGGSSEVETLARSNMP